MNSSKKQPSSDANKKATPGNSSREPLDDIEIMEVTSSSDDSDFTSNDESESEEEDSEVVEIIDDSSSESLKLSHLEYLGEYFFEPVLELYVKKQDPRSCRELDRLAPTVKVIPMSKIRKTQKTTHWLTGGVIISSETALQDTGCKYATWNMTDLKGDIKIVKVRLLGAAYTRFEGEPPGTLVALLRPTIVDSPELVISVKDVKQVLVLGQSAEYGICGKLTKEGETCSKIVNVIKCKTCKDCGPDEPLEPLNLNILPDTPTQPSENSPEMLSAVLHFAPNRNSNVQFVDLSSDSDCVIIGSTEPSKAKASSSSDSGQPSKTKHSRKRKLSQVESPTQTAEEQPGPSRQQTFAKKSHENCITPELLAFLNRFSECPANESGLPDIDTRFRKLELPQELVQVLSQTTSLEINIWRCVQCRRVTTTYPTSCKDEDHIIQEGKATECFYECDECQYRRAFVNSRPKSRCPKCSAIDWHTTSMIRTKSRKMLTPLSVRPVSQETYF